MQRRIDRRDFLVAAPGRHDDVMRARLAILVLALGLCGAVAVVATAQSTANGLPAYTNGYTAWKKLNRKPLTGGSLAHSGVKNVYASKPRSKKLFPNGTVIVKTIADRGATGLPAQVAVMRKLKGEWRWVEYSLSGKRYSVLAQGQLCISCHMQARSRDWVFTRG
jgi:hypothetical protein